ncbi:hypothetical protein Psch_01754 [Pelotomaculum schinkii]|uniref:Uncharacterized protein n=1 Tax=Pelotomaculum schinkii TaxID=78350 RepID=A0A4Y7RHF7_9FIRM|nr:MULTISPECIES: hypothetical protein [Pelotomaculum]TEB08199.1 hypothetical protein Psch_01754 [Pelotomaculum schinkii]TEB14245.1 hypothetical protein Psfp_03066 [Pelotomaculum sp. FP]
MKVLFEYIFGWFSHAASEFSALLNKLPDFMVGNLIELLGVLFASVLVAIFSTLFVDKKREIQKVKARVLDLRLEQYDAIRSFVEDQSKTAAFPENIDAVKNNFEISGLSLKDNENCYSSQGIATEQKIIQALVKLENLTMNGLYILDDDVLGMLLQIKIYIMNLNMFSILLRGYYENKKNIRKKILGDNRREENNEDRKEVKIATTEDINQISEYYFLHLSIVLNNEYQNMIDKLQEMVIHKASKPRFERKEKNYRKIKTRQRLQNKALDKTILINKFPQLIHALASLSSAYFQEFEEQRDNTLKEFLAYAVDILGWQEGLSGLSPSKTK